MNGHNFTQIRIGEVKDNNIELVPGAEIIITTNSVLGTAEKVSITYQGLPQDVKTGEQILLDDGKLMFEVISTCLKKVKGGSDEKSETTRQITEKSERPKR